jgi:carbonic anhydrase/acetyltransferase-like protein (isoleucine patch superfamily)
MADHTFMTGRLVRAFVKKVRHAQEPARVTLPASRFVSLYGQHQDLAFHANGSASYDAWWIPKAPLRSNVSALLEGARPVCPPFREKIVRFPVPRNILGREHHDHPLTTTVAFHVRHWVHILWLNNLWPQIALVERITQDPLATFLRLLRCIRPTRRARSWAAARSFTYLGQSVDIHPTACVEGSILGHGCRVGPFALVRGSVLGQGVNVEERANVCFSVLGDRDFVSKNSTVFACVGYPDADLCINGMQFCVAGRGSALTSLVRPMDMKYREDVTIRLKEKSVTVKELMVGSCFGHHTFVGPEVLIAPGREIPNHTVIAPSPSAVLSRVDPRLSQGGLACVQGGTLCPYPTGKV